MCPGKQIEHDHIGGEVENTGVAQDAADQGDADETAVGIHGIESFDTVIVTAFRPDYQGGNYDAKHMCRCCSSKSEQEAPDKAGVIVCLIDCYDENRIYDHKKEI